MEFRRHTLDNGLEIIAECSDSAYSMGMGFFVNTGARDETPEVAGVSHFLEHMTFKGTPKRSAADVNRELDEIGSQSNAYTSEEHTVYYAAMLPDYQDEAIDILSDIMRPSLRDDDFNTEKKVIIEEIHKYDDQPPFGGHEKSMAAYFGDHPLGNSVLGTEASVSALTRDAMLKYFERRYSPGNLKLVAAGRVDFDRLVVSADKLCGRWQAYDVDRDTRSAEGNFGRHYITRESATQEYIIQLAPGPAADDDVRYAQRLAAVVFGDDSASRLFWELVDTGAAEYAAMGPYEYQGAGVMMTFVCCAPDDAEKVMDRLAALQQQLRDDGITADELELAKSKVCSQIVRRAERPSSRLFAVGSNWLQRQQYLTVKQTVEAYQNVTVEHVNECLRRFPLTENTTVFAGPLQG